MISSPDHSEKKVYTQNRLLNGEKYTNTWISHWDLVKGGELKVETGEKPAIRNVSPSELPYSMSTEK